MHIEIDLAAQTLQLYDASQLIRQYSVSTAANGIGEQQGSMKTPRGLHTVRAMIGQDLPLGSVLRGRRATGEIHTPELSAQFPERDWILSRIIWLSGRQPGFNRLGSVDTMRRYIYIHGTPDDQPMGVPGSHGCIRMRNEDVVDLFDRIQSGVDVLLRFAATADQQTSVAAVPVNALPGLRARLQPFSLMLPASPVPSADNPAWALWLADGHLLALAQLQAGSGLLLWQAAEYTVNWAPLLAAAQHHAAALGWRELRLALPQAGQGNAVLPGFEQLRTLGDGVLLRAWLEPAS